MQVHTWVLGPCAIVVGAVVGEITFGPEPGTELERRWSESLSLEVDSLTETIGGNPVDLPFDTISFEGRRAFELSDELARCEGGRPVDLTRRYSTSSLGLALRLDDRPVGRVEGRSACDGSAVRFVYDSEEERYTKERIEGEIDAELMDRLEPDLDLLEFLPAGEVEAGATWELDPETLRHFFAAGGDLGFEVTEAVAEMEGVVPREILVAGALGSLHELFAPGSELSGKVEASYAGEHESGSELARLELEIHVEARIDLGARLQLLLGEDVLPGHREFTVEGALEGRLVVLWNQARKHLSSARFEGEASLSGHLVFPVEIAEGHPALEFVGDYELAGEAEVELVVE